MLKRINNQGQSILEVIVAMAIFALIASAMISMAVGGFIGLDRGGEQLQAESLAQEGLEAVYSIKDRAWNSLAFTTSSVSTSSERWIFDGEGTTETIGDYTRTISFEDVCRDESDDIIDCPGTYIDPHTKKVHVAVSWDVGADEPSVVEKIAYLTNWDTLYWPQSDWVGGIGQSIWSNITRYDSDDGGVIVSTAGQVTLDQTFSTSGSSTWPFDVAGNYTYTTSSIEVSGGEAFLTGAGGGGSGETLDDGFEYTTDTSTDWPFTTSSNYVFNASDIEVAGGIAQLKQSAGGSCSGSVNACNTFSTSGSCTAQGGCLWGDGISGATTNANFSSALIPWTNGTWATAPTLSRSATGGNPTGYAKIQFPNTKSKTSGGYFQQSFTVTGATSIATLNLDWIVSQYTGTADSLHLYAFIDTAAGTPTIGGAGQVWDSGNRTAVSTWASTGNINVASKITGAGTYYLKIVTYVDYKNGGANRQYATGFDNVQLSWTGGGSCSGTATACNTYGVLGTCDAQGGCSWIGGSYPTSTPSIYPSVSYFGFGVQAWNSFSEIATKNGGEIGYQLSGDDGTTWQYWTGSAWSTAGASNYNTASVVNTNISSFFTSNEQIKFKAFLSSNGSQLVQLDNISVGLTPPTSVWSFSDWGVGGGGSDPNWANSNEWW